MSSRRWIFLRGLARQQGHWGDFPEIFQNYFPEDQIELLDLRGNGDLNHSPSYLSIAENVRDLRARSKLLNQGDVHLLTISLGAMVGVEWTYEFSDEIAGLVAINTSDRGTSAFYERLRLQNLPRLASLMLHPGAAEHRELEILKMTTNTLSAAENWAKKFAELPMAGRENILRQLIAAIRYEFPRHIPKTEILLLNSDKDRFVNPICSQRIADQWTLKVQTHPTAGHDIPLEAPEWICQQIQDWISFSSS
ncbi:MAG: alpha/beta hydrolase [Bdellovibrio sp. CG10_big_fil_rev_8_21_14_0_10_47_8]|nr:MAG: alpha/beta hydrolase [Bdellovibrio sp. CG10_big_fil_rev_8_21_14_0_10_47_8]